MSLSSISAGDLLYCSTSSGRQFSIIASVDTINETITTDDVWPTESGVSWSVGGKRATLENSKQLLRDSFTGGKPELHLETDQTTSTSFYGTSASPMSATIRSSDGTQRTITQTASDYIFRGGSYTLQDIKLICTNATPAVSLLRFENATSYSYIIATKCHFAGGAQTLNSGGGSYGLRVRMQACEVSGFTSSNGAIYGQQFGTTTRGELHADFCYFHSNQRDVGNTSSGNTTNLTFVNCIFDGTNSGGWAIALGRANYTQTIGCVFYNYSSGAWYFSFGTPYYIRNCLFVNCGTAIGAYGSLSNRGSSDFSYFYNNTNNYSVYATNQDNDVELTADPFTDAANGDFSLNSDAGGGSVLRAETRVMGGTTAYPFNWLTDGSGGGGGGGGNTYHPLAEPNHPLAQ
tara:strand:+ start:1385 stop:2596 length:1212 start_codon:yes stop_codon:yes gene_type:complete